MDVVVVLDSRLLLSVLPAIHHEAIVEGGSHLNSIAVTYAIPGWVMSYTMCTIMTAQRTMLHEGYETAS